jgi:starch synthase
VDPDRFVADLAATLTDACSDVDRARQYGQAGLVRAKEHFSWAAIAEQTIDVYRNAIAAHSG